MTHEAHDPHRSTAPAPTPATLRLKDAGAILSGATRIGTWWDLGGGTATAELDTGQILETERGGRRGLRRMILDNARSP